MIKSTGLLRQFNLPERKLQPFRGNILRRACHLSRRLRHWSDLIENILESYVICAFCYEARP